MMRQVKVADDPENHALVLARNYSPNFRQWPSHARDCAGRGIDMDHPTGQYFEGKFTHSGFAIHREKP